jgi:glycosyltransferase involved in cell wall biosynthesis
MQVRKAGKRVVYEPHSILTHIEGGTSGTDTNSGFKKFQIINKEKFVKKWSSQLAQNHLSADTNPLLAARSGNPKKMLIIDSIVPERMNDSGSLRMFQIIKAALKLGYAVTFFPDNLVATPQYTPELQAMGVEVVYGKLTPRYFYKERMNMYDVVLLSRPTAAIWHLDLCKAYQPRAKIIYDTVDLHFLRIGRQAELEKSKALAEEAERWKQVEYYLMDNTDGTLVVSYEEQALLKKEKPNVRVGILSNINPVLPEFNQNLVFKDRGGLLFIGTYEHTPNRDAVEWFVKSVLPAVHKKLPDLEVNLLGSRPTPKVNKLATDLVYVPGFIDVVEPYFHRARVFICPVRFGAGVKGKLTQALACGLPIVTTSIGAEGMHLEHNKSCLVADTAKDFANAVVQLYTNQKLWETIHKNAGATYEKYFSEKAGLEALRDAIEQS